MKTSYYLVTAAGLAAAVAVLYVRWPSGTNTRPVPSLPVPADPAPSGPSGMASLSLPPIVPPPEAPLVIPAGGPALPEPVPTQTATPLPIPQVPAEPPPATSPSSPVPLPVPPVDVPPLPEPGSALPSAPTIPPVAPTGVEPPTLPITPTAPLNQPPVLPAPPPGSPETPPAVPQPAPVTPSPPAQPEPQSKNQLPLLPPPTLLPTPEANLAAAGKFIVLRGNKLIEGTATVSGDKVIVRQGALDRPFPKADVLFVGESRDDVYRFMLARVSATDPAARLSVAKWCMLSGLREQALGEAREILKLQPGNAAATDLARSLEESLRQFPPDGSTPKPQGGALVSEPEADVTAEGATSFASRAQPVLANQCMECHARTDYPGAFKLIRVTGFEAGPQSTRANLRATAAQLKKDDPLNSPLLAKALCAHGGMKQPAFVSRQAGGFRMLEAWVLQAVGTAAPPPMTPPAQPVLPPTPPVLPDTRRLTPPGSPDAPPSSPVIPPPANPLLPPVEPAPASPPAAVPPVLPTPPSLPSPDAGSRATPPMVPAIPVIPPAAAAPPVPGGVQPAGGQFGAGAIPVVPPAGPAGGDEFDPAGFNKPTPPRK